MDKYQILEDVKAKLFSVFSSLDYENLKDSEVTINKYFTLLNALNDLELDNTEEFNIETDELKEIYDLKNNVFLGQIHLNLSGANIGSFKIFIPEKLLRKLNIDEGDWVKATSVRTGWDLKPVYEYELIEKVNAPSNRNVIENATVEYDNLLNQYYILDTSEDKLPIKILLDQHKIGNFHLQVDDVIDYAYWNDDVLNGKVIWLHPLNSDIEMAHLSIPTSDTLNGYTIGVIGHEPNTDNLKSALMSNGADVITLSGSESIDTLAGAIIKANIIVIFIDSVGHDGMFKIRNVSKDFDIPILYTKSVDSETLIKMIYDELNIKE